MKKLCPTVDTLSGNLQTLLAETGWTKEKLARESGVTSRYISDIINKVYKPTVEVTDKLAGAFGLSGWQIILPGIHLNLARSDKLDKLVENYQKANREGRDYIDRVAAQESKYGSNDAA